MIRLSARRVALFGGVYSNHLSLEATLADAAGAGVEEAICLGDLGAFGPHPDRAIEIVRQAGIPVVQGNYDASIGHGLSDCRCGYTDPRDNHFAALSYRYTYARTSAENRVWLRDLPPAIRLSLGASEILVCHGSPRRANEFLWESTTSDAFSGWLLDETGADVLAVTHTGLPWTRELPGGRRILNVGAIGRPANDGDPRVAYAILDADAAERAPRVEWRRVAYEAAALAQEIRSEGLPEEFAETIETGWWTTCLEVLPWKERSRGRY